jgi:hypothetical protein
MSNSTSTSLLQSKQQDQLDEQAAGEHVRRLVVYSQELMHQYQIIPAVALERAWWHLLYDAAIGLRDALEKNRDRWHILHLTDKEVEHAYLTLIRAAYFFEAGGVAEAVFQASGAPRAHHPVECKRVKDI